MAAPQEPKQVRDPFAGELPSDRTKTLKVIGAGLPRTGTLSLTIALCKLLHGDVCHGGSACLQGPEHVIKGWTKSLNPGKNLTQQEIDEMLKDLLAGYVATTDAPAIFFVEELVRLYPDAKVICTLRDPSSWWESYQALIKTINNPILNVLQMVQPTLRYAMAWKIAIVHRRRKIYQPGFEPLGPHFMDIHTDYLKRVVPEDRLFFINMKDGWEPLCRALDVPVPDEPFPHLHDRAAMKEGWGQVWWKGAMIWSVLLGVGAVIYKGVMYLM